MTLPELKQIAKLTLIAPAVLGKAKEIEGVKVGQHEKSTTSRKGDTAT